MAKKNIIILFCTNIQNNLLISKWLIYRTCLKELITSRYKTEVDNNNISFVKP